ncbi:hypothetical protein MesoLj113b_32400 [Mesorhizobium sp. 113-3-3]|nr:hypothetical protein MesoLj113b_32400 [Mesorhizobium sp. 113-3-3]
MVSGKGIGSPLAKSRLRKWDSSAARDFAVSDMSSILAFLGGRRRSTLCGRMICGKPKSFGPEGFKRFVRLNDP